MRLAQIAAVASAVSGVGAAGGVVYSVAKSEFVTRADFDRAEKEHAAEVAARETAHAQQLAGWQATLNQLTATVIKLDDKFDAVLLRSAASAETERTRHR